VAELVGSRRPRPAATSVLNRKTAQRRAQQRHIPHSMTSPHQPKPTLSTAYAKSMNPHHEPILPLSPETLFHFRVINEIPTEQLRNRRRETTVRAIAARKHLTLNDNTHTVSQRTLYH